MLPREPHTAQGPQEHTVQALQELMAQARQTLSTDQEAMGREPPMLLKQQGSVVLVVQQELQVLLMVPQLQAKPAILDLILGQRPQPRMRYAAPTPSCALRTKD